MHNIVDAFLPRVLRPVSRPAPGALPRLATLASLLVLGGCSALPAYQNPALPMPATYAARLPAAASQAVALDVWWQGFDDLTLTRLITRVLAQNLDLAAALARVDQARALVQQRDAALYPTATLAADAVGEHQSLQSPLGKIGSALPGFARNASFYDLGAGASWERDLGEGLQHGIDAASADFQAVAADGTAVRIALAAEAADAYFQVRGAQLRIALALDQVRIDTRLLALVQLRLQDGLATRRERVQAEALLAQTNATLPPLYLLRTRQMNRLDVLMGAYPGANESEVALTPPAALSPILMPPVSLAAGPGDLLRRRPDVIAAERRLAASHARIGVANAAYYPTISLSALLGVNSLGSTSLLSGASFGPQAGVGLRWRLFDFGRIDAEVAQAKGANAEALAHYRQALLRATEDVDNAVSSLTQLTARHIHIREQVTAQAEARDLSEEAYKGGLSSLYEVLEDDRLLLSARDQMAQVQTDTQRAVVATFRALGGGW